MKLMRVICSSGRFRAKPLPCSECLGRLTGSGSWELGFAECTVRREFVTQPRTAEERSKRNAIRSGWEETTPLWSCRVASALTGQFAFDNHPDRPLGR
eukprot:1005882-Rhodomonas_salina.1